jgi:hypothetical protein
VPVSRQAAEARDAAAAAKPHAACGDPSTQHAAPNAAHEVRAGGVDDEYLDEEDFMYALWMEELARRAAAAVVGEAVSNPIVID